MRTSENGQIVIARVHVATPHGQRADLLPTECPHCGHDLTQPLSDPEPLGEITADVTSNPEVRPRALRVLVALLEAFDGRRPYSQMVALASPQVIRYLRTVAEMHGRERPSRVLSCHVSQPHEGAAELAALCRIGRRARAVAARFEFAESGDWRCVALRML